MLFGAGVVSWQKLPCGHASRRSSRPTRSPSFEPVAELRGRGRRLGRAGTAAIPRSANPFRRARVLSARKIDP